MTARSLRVSSGMPFSVLAARIGVPEGTGRTMWTQACVGPRVRPPVSSTPRSEAQSGPQPQLVVALAAITTCLLRRLRLSTALGPSCQRVPARTVRFPAPASALARFSSGRLPRGIDATILLSRSCFPACWAL